jgi:citrate synthase
MNTLNPGLQDVVVAATRLSHVDGEKGELTIAGFALEGFATSATFEETLYLLWHGDLPNTAQLERFTQEIRARRELSGLSQQVVSKAEGETVPFMELLRMASGTVSSGDDLETALTLIAQLPTMVAALWRRRNQLEPIAPRGDLGLAANYLWMLDGIEPQSHRTRALETYLNTIVDHGLNASTFTARVIISTGSDLVSAVVGAIGSLKGPLHGGAPGPALDMVFEIGKPERIEAVLRSKLESGERLMGFGHRIYKVRDPRAEVLSLAAQQFFQGAQEQSLYPLAKAVEAEAVKLLAEYKPGRQLQTNVEFYTALLLHGLGLPTELFTPTFSLGRLGGWCAHCFEQRSVGRIMRPQSFYTGESERQWIPLNLRR